MDTVIQETLFPLPEPTAPTSYETPWERFRHFSEVSDIQGGLIPQNILPDLLGLSKQRVSVLVQDGRFTTFQLFGQKFVTGESMATFIREERKSGRPCKAPSTLTLMKASLRMGREITGQK